MMFPVWALSMNGCIPVGVDFIFQRSLRTWRALENLNPAHDQANAMRRKQDHTLFVPPRSKGDCIMCPHNFDSTHTLSLLTLQLAN